MPYTQFDRSKLILKPLSERIHDLDISVMLNPATHASDYGHPSLAAVAEDIRRAKDAGAAVIMAIGGHVIRSGVARYLIMMMERGFLTHLSMNGACAIHDYEFARIGATTESVEKYISEGQFGLWRETGELNDIAQTAADQGIGWGEAIGRAIHEGDFPYVDTSVLAAGYRLGVPVTIHAGIGSDIIHEHPNCVGSAIGSASYNDFLVYVSSISNLENGVFMCFGTAVAGPEVYLKALSMARNVAHQDGKRIAHFTTLVCDLLDLEGADLHETPPKTDPRYYYRPFKTILARTVKDGGKSYYVQGLHRDTVPCLAKMVIDQ